MILNANPERGHLTSCDAICTLVVLQRHAELSQSTQARDKEDAKNGSRPKMLMTEIPGGWMEAQETEEHFSLVQFSCNQD